MEKRKTYPLAQYEDIVKDIVDLRSSAFDDREEDNEDTAVKTTLT